MVFESYTLLTDVQMYYTLLEMYILYLAEFISIIQEIKTGEFESTYMYMDKNTSCVLGDFHF